MKISTEIGSISYKVGEMKAVEYVAKAGFDAWDFSMFAMAGMNWKEMKAEIRDWHPLNHSNYLGFARELRKIGEDLGIHCNQSHAPFPTHNPIIGSCLKRAIEATAEAGGKICVIHPDNHKSAEENAELYMSLLPFAKGCGVKIAAENMWNWNNETQIAAPAACSDPKSFLAHLEAVNDDYLVACLDIGHAEMKGLNTTAPEMIRALGKHLQALHIHDNDKIHDSHKPPFSMNIDFNAVAKALKETGYNGYLTLEADSYMNDYSAENAFDGVVKLAESAKRFRALMAD